MESAARVQAEAMKDMADTMKGMADTICKQQLALNAIVDVVKCYQIPQKQPPNAPKPHPGLVRGRKSKKPTAPNPNLNPN
jgi:hypothetical protein